MNDIIRITELMIICLTLVQNTELSPVYGYSVGYDEAVLGDS